LNPGFGTIGDGHVIIVREDKNCIAETLKGKLFPIEYISACNSTSILLQQQFLHNIGSRKLHFMK